MQTRQSVLLFILLTIVLPWQVESQTPITCSAGHYKPGEKASITCYYHGDIGTEQNTGLHITWYSLDAPKDSSGNKVLICHSKEGAVRVCNPEEGYRFLGINKDNLTIEVPDVSAEFQGRYSCGVVPGNGRVVRPCILLVEGAYKLEKKTPRNPVTQETLHGHVKTTHALMILTFILMAVAVAAIIYLTLAYRNLWFPFGKPDTSRPEENNQMLPLYENKSTEKQSVKLESEVDGPESITTPQHPSASVDAVDDDAHSGSEESEVKKSVKKSVLKKQRQRMLHTRLEQASSTEEKTRIQKEFNDMLFYSRSGVPVEQKNGIQEEYVKTMERLNGDVSEEEKQRIQEKYDKTKTEWNKSRK